MREITEALPEPGSLRSGPGEVKVDHAEVQGKEPVPVEAEDVPSDLPAFRAEGQLMQQRAVLVLGPVQGQHALQRGLIQVLVFQGSPSRVPRSRVAHTI